MLIVIHMYFVRIYPSQNSKINKKAAVKAICNEAKNECC